VGRLVYWGGVVPRGDIRGPVGQRRRWGSTGGGIWVVSAGRGVIVRNSPASIEIDDYRLPSV
jgi:hypothetical protein